MKGRWSLLLLFLSLNSHAHITPSQFTKPFTIASQQPVLNLYIHLNDTDQSNNSGFNASFSKGSTTLGANNSGHDKQGQTLATIGKTKQGIKVGANQDLNNSQKITQDWQTSGLNASLTADHRVFTKGGRNSIAEDVVKSKMLYDTGKQVATTEKVDLFNFNEKADFSSELKKNHDTYEGGKEAVMKDPALAAALADPKLSEKTKKQMMQKVTNAVMIKLGYKTVETKLVNTDAKGQFKGHFGEDNKIYINDRYIEGTADQLKAQGHELAHAMDQQQGSFKAGDKDQNTYANNYGDNLSGYTSFISKTFGKGELGTDNATRNQPLSAQTQINNADFAKLDKQKGDDAAITAATIAIGTLIYTTFVGDGNPQQGLETIGAGEDPVSNAISTTIEQGIETAHEIAPNQTQAVLEASNKVGQMKEAVVTYIDDATGKTISQSWNKLDKSTQNQLKGAGKILSVTVSSVGLAKLGKINASEQIIPSDTNVLEANKLEVAKNTDDFVDLTTPARRRHILDGDATGGDHRLGTGKPGKNEFPAGRSDDSIIHDISDIATDPTLRSRLGRGGRTITDGTRNGIDIRVIQERNGYIVTGFPTNVPRNPR